VPVHQEGVFRPHFAAVHGARAGGLPTAEGPHIHAVDDRQVRVQFAGPAEQAEQVGVEPVPAAEFLPLPEVPLGRPAGAAQLGQNVFPATARSEDEPQDLEDQPVFDHRPPAARPDRVFRWQVVGGELVEPGRHPGTGHGE
jgi:hypothetical protein